MNQHQLPVAPSGRSVVELVATLTSLVRDQETDHHDGLIELLQEAEGFVQAGQAEAAPVSPGTPERWAALTGREHTLKTDPLVFEESFSDRKTFEIRRDDRGFEEGDMLRLRETRFSGADMAAGQPLDYTGRELVRRVVGVMRGPAYGLVDGWVLLSVAALDEVAPQEVSRISDALALAFGAVISAHRAYGEFGTRDSDITAHNTAMDRAATALKTVLDHPAVMAATPGRQDLLVGPNGKRLLMTSTLQGVRAQALMDAVKICHNRMRCSSYSSAAGREAANISYAIRELISPKRVAVREHEKLNIETVTGGGGSSYEAHFRGSLLFRIFRVGVRIQEKGQAKGVMRADGRRQVSLHGPIGLKVSRLAYSALRARQSAALTEAAAAKGAPVESEA